MPPSAGDTLPEQYASGEHSLSPVRTPAPRSSSPSGGLACAIAALAERQRLSGEFSNYNGHVSDILPSTSRSTKRVKMSRRNCPEKSSAKEIPSARMSAKECGTDHASEVAELVTSYASSHEFEGEAAMPSSPPPPPLYERWKSKRVKNDRRKHASLDRSCSKVICGERILAEWEFDYASVAADAGTSYGSSDESDKGTGATFLPPSPPLYLLPCDEAAVLPPQPPSLYDQRNSKRVKSNRRKFSFQRTSSEDSCGERTLVEDCEFDRGSLVAEAGTAYGNSGESDEGTGPTALLPLTTPPLALYEVGTSGSCSDDGEDGDEYLALPPPPPPPHPYGWWPSVLSSSVQ